MMRNFDLKTKKVREKNGYTLIELLITILIVSIVITAVSVSLAASVKASMRADTRRSIRQDTEYALDVIRRDIRNSVPTLTATSCDPAAPTELALSAQTGGIGTPISFDLVLTGVEESVKYFVTYDGETRIVNRQYTKGSEITNTELSTVTTDISSFRITCYPLLQGNKFIQIEMGAQSVIKGIDDKPIVSNVNKITGATIRNVAN